MLTENDVQRIIGKFDANISEYEIIDLEKLKGWSSEFLFLIVSPEENYILKAKTSEQIKGYDNEVKVSNALLANNIEARKPILTKDNQIFINEIGYFWCLMTYIPGAPSHINEYNENTVKTLAGHIDQYIVASIVKEGLKHIDIKTWDNNHEMDTLELFFTKLDVLEKFGININLAKDIFPTIKSGYNEFFSNYKIESIIHNDINPRNILMDHATKNVISVIDWDHVRYGNPLKDLSDAIAIFYDNLETEKAMRYKKIFLQNFTSDWYTQHSVDKIDFSFLFYYTYAKWRACLFYLDLLEKYDNTYGERDRFIEEIIQNYNKWKYVTTSKYI